MTISRTGDRHPVVRRVTIALVTAAVAGCSTSGSASTQHSPSSAPAAAASAAPEAAQAWDDSVCAALDADEVAKAASTGMVDHPLTAPPPQRVVFSSLGSPAFDYCRIALRQFGHPHHLYYGVSVATWSSAQWKAYTRKALAGNGPNPRFPGATTEHVPGMGDALVEQSVLGTRGLLHVGDRVVAVYGGATESERLVAELRLVRPLAHRLQPGPAVVTDPKCDASNSAAAAALGAPATIRRDTRVGGELTCGWATRDAFIEVSGTKRSSSAQLVRSIQRNWRGARAVDGVGKAAVYADLANEGPRLRVATDQRLVVVEGAGARIGERSLAKVAKTLLPNY